MNEPYNEDNDKNRSGSRHRILKEKLHSFWDRIELFIGHKTPFSPSTWSWIKLFICTPLISTGLWLHSFSNAAQPSLLDGYSWIDKKWVFWFFFLSLIFDFLRRTKRIALKMDRMTSEDPSLESPKWIDRLGDLPLSILATYCLLKSSQLPFELGKTLTVLLLGRVLLDILTSLMLLIGRGPERTKLRTVISELSLYVIIALIMGLNTKILNIELAHFIIGMQVIFSSVVFAYQLRLLQKRFIADTLSALNFICGLISLYYSSLGRFDTSLLFLLLGGAFDGFDGAAARKFGGTKFGVYSDDIADGMNYGIAPAYAVYCLLGGIEGLIIGAFYATFTISRLLYFTLNKEQSDPSYFAGVPSPVGGMMVMSSVVLFIDKPLWVSFIVGISSTLMVSFKTPYVHVFRAFSWRSPERKRQALIGAPLFLVSFLLVTVFYGTVGAAAVILFGSSIYGFIPSLLSFYLVLFPPPQTEIS